MCFKSSLPLVLWDDLDVVVAFSHVEFAEEDLISESFDRLTNIWKWCDIFDCVFVQFAEVLYDALHSIFLGDRKGW